MLTDTVQVFKETCPINSNSLEFQAEPCAGGYWYADAGQGKNAARVYQTLEFRRMDREHPWLRRDPEMHVRRLK
jgi:hypothetical protein